MFCENLLNMRTSGLLLFLCAGLLLSGGAILGGSTAWGMMRMSYYFWITDLGVEMGAAVMLIVGALLCLPACWLATVVPYYPRSFTLHATLMCLVTSSMLVLSIGLSSLGGLSRALRGPDALNVSMQQAMARESINPSVRSAFSSMQLELRCCGVSHSSDWLQHRPSLPPSCCNRVHNARLGPQGPVTTVKREQCDIPVFFAGCLSPALTELNSFVTSTSALTAAIILIMGVTMFASVYMLVSCVTDRNLDRSKTLVSPPLRLSCVHNLPNTLSPPPFSTILQQAPPPQSK